MITHFVFMFILPFRTLYLIIIKKHVTKSSLLVLGDITIVMYLLVIMYVGSIPSTNKFTMNIIPKDGTVFNGNVCI